MKKSYVKPMIDFESFELAEFIADCGVTSEGKAYETNFYMKDHCGVMVPENENIIFVGNDINGEYKCNTNYDPTAGGGCYGIAADYLSFFKS